MKKDNIHIIKEKQLNDQFHRDGFLLMDLLSLEELQKLETLYAEYATQLSKVDPSIILSATQDCQDATLYQAIDRGIKKILLPIVEKHFINYQPLIGAFLIKRAGDDTYMNLHQDWNLTDESKYFSFNIWIPLQAIDDENGCLQFLPGSHKIIPTIRPNFSFDWAFRNVTSFIKKRLVNLYPKKGQCVLINHAVIHASETNRRPTPRVAAFLTLIPKNAKILHYFCEDKENVEVYQLVPEEFYQIEYLKRPGNSPLEKYNYLFPTVRLWYMYLWYYFLRFK